LTPLLELLPPADPSDNELHLKRIVGLDIDEFALERAREVVKFREEMEDMSNFTYRERWEMLRVEIWKGNLEVRNLKTYLYSQKPRLTKLFRFLMKVFKRSMLSHPWRSEIE
jgi:hypothetical protein